VTRKNNENHDRLSGNMKYAQPQNLSVVTPEHQAQGRHGERSHPGNSRVVGYTFNAHEPARDEKVTGTG